MSGPTRGSIGAAIIVMLAMPPMRRGLEDIMVLHMLVQIPLLAFAGGLLATEIPASWTRRIAAWNGGGVSGILLALIVSSWWMAPRALDSALSSNSIELWKFVSLPLFVGAPVALSWRALGMIGRGFVLANVLPMWAVVGWLYVAAPVRLCNFYLVDQQVVAGAGLLAASIALSVAFGLRAFGSFSSP